MTNTPRRARRTLEALVLSAAVVAAVVVKPAAASDFSVLGAANAAPMSDVELDGVEGKAFFGFTYRPYTGVSQVQAQSSYAGFSTQMQSHAVKAPSPAPSYNAGYAASRMHQQTYTNRAHSAARLHNSWMSYMY